MTLCVAPPRLRRLRSKPGDRARPQKKGVDRSSGIETNVSAKIAYRPQIRSRGFSEHVIVTSIALVNVDDRVRGSGFERRVVISDGRWSGLCTGSAASSGLPASCRRVRVKHKRAGTKMNSSRLFNAAVSRDAMARNGRSSSASSHDYQEHGHKLCQVGPRKRIHCRLGDQREYLCIRAGPNSPWEIQINPAGSRHCLARPGHHPRL